MSRYDSYWPPYVPVSQRKAKAQKQLEKLKKKRAHIHPVQIAGRKIAASFWGKGWCDHMESFSDYTNRLPRGRSYVRNGSVCHLEITKGQIEAIVSGSALYNVSISISPLKLTKWESLKCACSGKIGSLIDLLRGKIDRGVMEVVTDHKSGLFPLPGEMKFDCDCPDWADMCKHVAAVLYGVGARLDDSPEMLFALRGVNHEELVDVTAVITDVAKAGTSRRRIATSGIADVFGIEVAEDVAPAPDELPALQPKRPVKKPAAAIGRPSKVLAPFPEPLTGEAIRTWRMELGETQARFAKRINVTGSTVSQWEKRGSSEVSMFPCTLDLLRKVWRTMRK